MQSGVAIVQTRPETVLQDYARVLDLAGMTAAGSAHGPLAICLDHDRRTSESVAATHSPPWQVDGVVSGLLAHGFSATDLRLSSPPAARMSGETLALWRSALSGRGRTLPQRSDGVPAAGLPILLLAAMRTDRRLGLPGCIGTLADHLTPSTARHWRRRHAGLLPDFRQARADRTVFGGVIDATICGAGPDVHRLQPVAYNLLLAGRDPVAVDAVAARLAGLDPASLPLLKAAATAGWGCNDPAHIELVGDVRDAIPTIDLSSVSRYRGRSVNIDACSRAAAPGLTRHFPWVSFRTGQYRRRYAATAWGCLRQDYLQRNPFGDRRRS